MNLRKLFEHMRWADAAVLQALRSASPPAKALEIYAHILGAEHVWLARLDQRPPTHAVWPAIGLDQCTALATEVAAGFQAYLDQADAATLASEIPYTNSAGQSFLSRVDDILIHVALHGCYHRGQIALLLRAAGTKPAPTDYIGFVRGVPAATRSPSNSKG
jgi:uncharacterized damage-inducible protein DinB